MPDRSATASTGQTFAELDPARLERVAEEARERMEALSADVRELISCQPPLPLLSYIICNFHSAIMQSQQDGNPAGPDEEVHRVYQFALEYLHAVWSGAGYGDSSEPLSEEGAAKLFETLDNLSRSTMQYCIASSAITKVSGADGGLGDLEFHAKSSWALIRGNRYQVLEEEFFRFVLAPHDAALLEAYGEGAKQIAAGIQAIADVMRTGVADAAEALQEPMSRFDAAVAQAERVPERPIEILEKQDPSFRQRAADLVEDMLFGGICNLTKHSKLPRLLLEDLSYGPGENSEFFAEGQFCGTPMRTLPARVKPGIKIRDVIYATDSQFVRDSAYRSIQRGLLQRLPYRDTWLKRQGELMEEAFTHIFDKQLSRAQVLRSVFYRELGTGRWVEADRLILIEDVLIIIEAKAGNLPMQSPASNFSSHERAIKGLLFDAYKQCRRLVDYLAGAREVSLYSLAGGKYTEVAKVNLSKFRLVIPIGLTVEAFTPFSALSKELPGVEPIGGKFPFVSMSVDDLFVLDRFLPTTGELTHYLGVRQSVAGLKGALLFDEIDHLGAYIQNNRFDNIIREQLKEADLVTWSAFSSIVDRYFEGRDWSENPVPKQDMPAKIVEVLAVLDQHRPAGWLTVDRFIRDYGAEGRENLARCIEAMELTLDVNERRRFELGGDAALQVWLCRGGREPNAEEYRYHAQSSCVTFDVSCIPVLTLVYMQFGQIAYASCRTFSAPSALQIDFAELRMVGQGQRSRIQDMSNPKPKARRKSHNKRRR